MFGKSNTGRLSNNTSIPVPIKPKKSFTKPKPAWYSSFSCSGPPDTIYLFDENNPTPNYNATDSPIPYCGSCPLGIPAGCCISSLDLEFTVNYTSITNIYVMDTFSLSFPVASNGFSYCKLAPSDSTSLDGYDGVYYLGNDQCIDGTRCNRKDMTFSVFEHPDCTGNTELFDITNSSVQNSLAFGDIFIDLVFITNGSVNFSWYGISPQSSLVPIYQIADVYNAMDYADSFFYFNALNSQTATYWNIVYIKQFTHTINLHPQYFGRQIKEFLIQRLYAEVEGTCSGRYGFTISVVDIVDIGKGVLQSNTGYAEYRIEYKAIVFKPFRNEVFDGIVTTVNKVGFWCEVGPLQVFISQHLIPEYLQFDPNSNPAAYVGKGEEFGDAGVRIEKGEAVRIRISGTRVEATAIFATGTLKEDYLGPSQLAQ
ncbi:DNA-directed RNA polymerase II subunit [Terramyces sp. JEL0728]|nr:DNA-directed RNA polymerase II subunit [Terramyces sp. JEL0728]